MAELDRLVVKIETDLKDLKKGLSSANKSVQRSSTDIQKSLASIGTRFNKLGSQAIKFGAVASVAVGGVFVRSVIKTGMEIEQLEIQLNNLFGSATEGKKAFEAMLDFAGQVPFTLREIQGASANLAVVSDDAEELSKILTITGNVAAVTGLSFRQTAEQIQRSFAGGIAAADVFREKGVRAMLGFEAGATVSAEQTIAKFEEVFGKGGKFGNVTEELSNTLAGTLTMIQDKFLAFQIAVSEGFFAELKRQFGDLNKLLDNNLENIKAFGKDLGQNLGDALADIIRNLDRIIFAFKILFGAVIIGQLQAFILTVHKVTKAITGLNIVMRANPILMSLGLIATGFILFRDEVNKTDEAIKSANKNIREFEEARKEGRVVPMGQGTFRIREKAEDEFDLDQFRRNAQTALAENEKLILAQKRIKELGFDEQLKEEKGVAESVAEERRKKLLESLKEQEKIFLEGLESRNKMEVQANEERILELEDQMQKQMDIFNNAGDAISKAFSDAIVHGKDFKDAMYNVFQSVIAQVIQLIAQLLIVQPILDNISKSIQGQGGSGIGGFIGSAAKNFFGGFFGGGKAAGGNVMANTPYLVGEKGPEIFTPQNSGRIIPNNQIGGGGTVNQTLQISTGVAQTVRAEVMNLMPVIKQETLAAVVDARRKGGSFARTFGA